MRTQTTSQPSSWSPWEQKMGVFPPHNGFLEGLRQVTLRNGALLTLGEVMTGFRVAYGGAQERYGIKPDLTTMGKVIGGGLPVGAYAGTGEILKTIAPAAPMYRAGTLSGNPLAMTTGIETLRLLSEPGVFQDIESRAATLMQGLAEATQEAGVPVFQTCVSTMFSTFFTSEPVSNFRTAQASHTGHSPAISTL